MDEPTDFGSRRDWLRSLATPDVLPDASEVPVIVDTLPDGREVLVIGDVAADRDFHHHQGDNPFNLQSDCGLVSCETVLRQFGLEVTEADIVRYALQHGLCEIAEIPEASGGMTMEGIAQVLSDFDVPSHIERIGTAEDLALLVEHGHGVVLGLDAGHLWNDPRHWNPMGANHAVSVTGVARDRQTGEIAGFYINDSGVEDGGGRFVEVDLLDHSFFRGGAAFFLGGGECVVTDLVR